MGLEDAEETESTGLCDKVDVNREGEEEKWLLMEEDEWFLAQGAGWIVMPFAEIGQTRGEAGLADGDAHGFSLLERDMYVTTEHSVEFPKLYSRFLLVTYSIHSRVCISI